MREMFFHVYNRKAQDLSCLKILGPKILDNYTLVPCDFRKTGHFERFIQNGPGSERVKQKNQKCQIFLFLGYIEAL